MPCPAAPQAYNMRNTLRDDKLSSKLDAGDKSKMEKAIDDALHWLEANQLAEVDEVEHQQKELEGVCSPIIARMYQAGGGMPGGMGDVPMGGAGASSGRGGPTVEEVD